MNKLIKELQKAYAGELGAYNAYVHHYKATGDLNIGNIADDEFEHIAILGTMLINCQASPDRLRNLVFTKIGYFIGIFCYVFSAKSCARGALILERIGKTEYKKISKLARSNGRLQMATKLSEMSKTEERHEEYFKRLLTERRQ